jgi:hypothetical protein
LPENFRADLDAKISTGPWLKNGVSDTASVVELLTEFRQTWLTFRNRTLPENFQADFD